jgi:Co/Zn/Cd efflux system component
MFSVGSILVLPITMGDQKWYKTKTCRLLSMLALTFSFFLVELVYGYITHSLALISDSYHMLSDVVALGVGIASVRVNKLYVSWHSHKVIRMIYCD